MDIPANPTWLGSFKGAEHSFLDCEVLALECVEPALMERMWEASTQAWFDYVRLHPVKSFLYFCHCYGKAFGSYLYANVNHELRFRTGLKGDPLKHRELRALVGLKTAADELGIPYDVWLNGLFDYFSLQGWTRPPRPAHMLASAEAREHAAMRWALRVESQVVYPKDSWFATESFCGHPQQLRCERHITDSVAFRPNKDIALASAIYDMGMLRFERAIEVFPAQIVEAVAWAERFKISGD